MNEIRQIFESFDNKRVGSLKPNEAPWALGLGWRGFQVQGSVFGTRAVVVEWFDAGVQSCSGSTARYVGAIEGRRCPEVERPSRTTIDSSRFDASTSLPTKLLLNHTDPQSVRQLSNPIPSERKTKKPGKSPKPDPCDPPQ